MECRHGIISCHQLESVVLGENIKIEKANQELITELGHILKARWEQKCDQAVLVVSICGESGSGKSVQAFAVSAKLEDMGLRTVTLQMDDFYKLPPESNRLNRRKSLHNVGPQEVDLELLDEIVNSITGGTNDKVIMIPEVDYHANYKGEREMVVPRDLAVVILEGTYVSMLQTPDVRIFIQRTYKDTHMHRTARSREPQTDFLLEVLAIEHEIVKKLSESADLVISKEFTLLGLC